MVFPIAVGAAIYAEYYAVVVVFVVGGFLVFIVVVAFSATFDWHIGAKDAAKDESSVLLSEIFSSCFFYSCTICSPQ